MGFNAFTLNFIHREWCVNAYLLLHGQPIHSYMTFNKFDTPIYSWMHGIEPKPILYFPLSDK